MQDHDHDALRIDTQTATAIVRMAGNLDSQASERVMDAVEGVLANDGVETLVLDLTGISFATSEGVEALLQCTSLCEKKGVAVELFPSPNLRRVMDILNLGWVLDVPDALGLEKAFEDQARQTNTEPG